MTNIIDFPQPFAPGFVRWRNGQVNRVRKSIEYRLKASEFGRQADAETDEGKAKSLLQSAVWWIRLAENEEWLVDNSLIDKTGD
jgi:hypothetical protein